jgi:DNA-binding PadR family transcriptional regulator
MHGYPLVQHIKRTSQDLLQIEEGSLYPALQRLLKEEFVKAEWGVLLYEPPRSDLQVDGGGRKASGT